MSFSEDQIREIVEQRDRAIKRVEKYQAEISTLEKQVEIFDVILKRSSFSKASDLKDGPRDLADAASTKDRQGEHMPITHGGETIADAYVTPDEISIVLADSVSVSDDVPPFRSYFIERILNGMPSKDEGGVSHNISKDGDDIREIRITNHLGERAGEIVSTCGWTLNKMLEKTAHKMNTDG